MDGMKRSRGGTMTRAGGKGKVPVKMHTLLSTRALPGIRVCLDCGECLGAGQRNGPCKAAILNPRKRRAK